MFRLLVFLFSLVVAACLDAQPTITGISGQVEHGQSIIISGMNFGTKNPVAPLIWDTAENGTIGDFWSGAAPTNSNDEFNLTYKTLPFRNVAGAHEHNNNKVIAGGHDPSGYPPNWDYRGGPNVTFWKTYDTELQVVYLSFYHRLDPLWPTQNDNFKTLTGGPGPYPYASGWYMGWCASFAYSEMGNGCQMGYHCCQWDWDPVKWGFSLSDMKQWHREEIFIQEGSNGFVKIYHNNQIKWDTSNCDPTSDELKMVGIGGYWRKTRAEDGDVNAFRYWDDVYMDSTFSRVVLTNNSDYTQSTIIEPQIPTAWADGSITVTVNLGTISGQAYLFVFDASNNHNAVGFEVGSETPQQVPQNLRIKK